MVSPNVGLGPLTVSQIVGQKTAIISGQSADNLKPLQIGERLQAVACGQYFHDHVLSGARVELRDVAVDVFDLSKRGW